MAKRITKQDAAALRGILDTHDLGPCVHPDCDPAKPTCVTNYFYLRALKAVREAFRLGRGEHV